MFKLNQRLIAAIVLISSLSVMSQVQANNTVRDKANKLIALFATKKIFGQVRTINALKMMGRSAVPYLKLALNSKSEKIRENVVHVLGLRKDKSLALIYRKLISTDIPQVAAEAAIALGRLESKSEIPFFIRSYHNQKSVRVKEKIIWALSKVPSRRTFDFFRDRLLKDKPETKKQGWADSGLTQMTLRALGMQQDPVNIPIFKKFILHQDITVKKSAVASITKINDFSLESFFISLLKDENPIVVRDAVLGLGRIKSTKAISLIIQALDHKNIRVIRASTSALAMLQDSRAIDVLVKKFKDNSKRTARYDIVEALSSFKGEKVKKFMRYVVNDYNKSKGSDSFSVDLAKKYIKNNK